MTGSELVIPVRNNFSGKKTDQSFDNLDKTLKRCLQAIEDWAESPFVSSAHIQDASITTAHIQDASITTAKIQNLSVDILTSGTLTAETLLASTLRTGEPGNRRVEIADTGVKLLDSSDAIVVSLPTDADQPAYFAGSVVAADFLVNGAGTIRGVTSVDINGGEVSIAASAATPSTAPALGTGTAKTTFNSISETMGASAQTRRGLFWDGTNSWYLRGSGGTLNNPGLNQWVKVNAGGIETATGTIYDDFMNDPHFTSLVKVGAKWFGCVTGAAQQSAIVTRYSSDGSGNPVAQNGPEAFVVAQASGGGYKDLHSKLYTDGSTLWLATPYLPSGSNGFVNTEQINTSTMALSNEKTFTLPAPVSGSGVHVLAFFRGSGDFGATRNVFLLANSAGGNASFNPGAAVVTPGTKYFVFNDAGTPARQASEEWVAGGDGGLVYRSGAFYSMSRTQQVLNQYGPASGGFTASTYWVAFTYYDSNATGGTHESALSPRAPFTGGLRRQLQVTWPAIPSGGTDDPNSVRLYLKLAASDPGATFSDYFRQGSTYSGTNTTTLTTYNTGTAGSQDTAFPNSGSPGQLTSGTGGFLLKGDGTLVLPVFAADPGAGIEGQVYFNSVSNKFTGFDGTSWVALH